MADRYWVGGAGTWSSSDTTHWSATSGGAGGASVPTSADNVIFNSASGSAAYAVTLSGSITCADITVAGPSTGTLTWAGSFPTLTIYGGFSVAATGVGSFASATGMTLNLCATGAVNLNGNGVVMPATVTLNTATGTYTQTSAFGTASTTINITQGTWSTNGFALTCSGITFTANTLTRVMNWGSSVITIGGLGGCNLTTQTGLTVNTGTSVLTIAYSGGNVNIADKTIYDLNITVANATISSSGGSMRNLTWVANTITTVAAVLLLQGSLTVTGTFAVNGATNMRKVIRQTRQDETFTVAAVTGLVDVDFQGVKVAGASGTWSGTNLGDGGGNTNITFAPARTLYWVGGAAAWASTTAWSTTSGGAASLAAIPRPQDTGIWNSNATAATCTLGNGFMGCSIDTTARTANLTISGVSTAPIAGTTINLNPVHILSAAYIDPGPDRTVTITSSGTSNATIYLGNYYSRATFKLGSNFTCTGVTLTAGTLDLNNNTLTLTQLANSPSYPNFIKSGTTGKFVFGTSAASAVTNWYFQSNTLASAGGRVLDRCQIDVTGGGGGTRTFRHQLPSFQFDSAFPERLPVVTVSAGTGAVVFWDNPNSAYKDIIFTTGFTGSMTGPSSSSCELRGNLTLHSTMSATGTAGTLNWTVPSGSTGTLTSAGKTLNSTLNIQGQGTHSLAGALNLGTGSLTWTTPLNVAATGTFQTNDFAVTATKLTDSYTTGVAHTYALGSSTLTFTDSAAPVTVSVGSLPTLTGTYTIACSNASTTKVFAGGNCTYNNVSNTAGSLTFSGNNVFNIISNTATAATIKFTASSTNTINGLSVNGASGALTTLTSTTTTKANVNVASGQTVTVSWCNISNLNNSGPGAFSALLTDNNTNGGNNSGISFVLSTILGQFFLMF